MIDLGKFFLPTFLSINPISKRITLQISTYGTEAYENQIDCFLQITFMDTCLEIDYISEDGICLTNIISESLTELASGELKNESFQSIQENALKVLLNYIDDSQNEILNHFDEI
ncbi:hypothetical protein [uncultured Sunxiuqinia sp.]|uniref:hypothetical protein n=1 Tax=uncultured Sunxiuqinia sp. TaxID=1573825 RepID=UPI002AA80073|nr:hypothetical protein [uncultured Sunxiuqinia sp.]